MPEAVEERPVAAHPYRPIFARIWFDQDRGAHRLAVLEPYCPDSVFAVSVAPEHDAVAIWSPYRSTVRPCSGNNGNLASVLGVDRKNVPVGTIPRDLSRVDNPSPVRR